MNLDAVVAFATFADCMNLSTAAEALHISQPALHAKLRKLGEQLGVRLYVRVGRRLELTPQGEDIARFGREIAQQTRVFGAQMRDGGGGELTFAAGDGAYLYLLGPALRRFIAEGTTRLRLLTRDRDGALDAVRSGRAQLGVAPLQSVPGEFEARVLTTVRQMLVVRADHALARRRQLKLRDLAQCALIVPPEEKPHRQLLSRLLETAGVPWTVAVEATGWDLMLSFVQLGVGAAVVNAYCRLPRGLRGIPIPELPTLRYHVFHRRGLKPAGELARLSRALHAHADDWRAAKA
jgi:LysR family transcriptional regulator, low CO2-responsive transcriptional regulator